MNIDIVPLHWLALGLALLVVELFVQSMAVLWFGLAAILVAGVLYLFPEVPVSGQLFIWAVCSGLLTLAWFSWLKPRMADRTSAGRAYEAIVGENGIVIRAPGKETRGMVRFSRPIMGSDEWPFICEQEVAAGDRVVVKDVSGNTLVVEKHR